VMAPTAGSSVMAPVARPSVMVRSSVIDPGSWGMARSSLSAANVALPNTAAWTISQSMFPPFHNQNLKQGVDASKMMVPATSPPMPDSKKVRPSRKRKYSNVSINKTQSDDEMATAALLMLVMSNDCAHSGTGLGGLDGSGLDGSGLDGLDGSGLGGAGLGGAGLGGAGLGGAGN
jgi:hypothetical protein